MECPASAAVLGTYPSPLEFPGCDITTTACSATAACLVCLSPVQEPQLGSHNKLLRHSGVPTLTRLQQLLPLGVPEESSSVCAACVGLVVNIDELELQLSEQHCQLQHRHVQKAGQQDWEQAAEQVICSSEPQNPCSAGQQDAGTAEAGLEEEQNTDPGEPRTQQQAGMVAEVPGDGQKTGKHADLRPEIVRATGQKGEGDTQLRSDECFSEGTGHQIQDKSEEQEEMIGETQVDGKKNMEGSMEQPPEIQATTTVENMLEDNTETAGRPVRSTRNVKPKKYTWKLEGDDDDPDDPSAPSVVTAAAADAGSAARRRAELQRRSLASLSVDRAQERPYQCRICERRLRDRTTALRHAMSHLAERPFLCPQCPRGFVRRSYLQAHMCQHTGERPFSCHCGHAAVSAAALAAHRKAHYAAKPVRCAQCDKRFRKRSDLVVHQRTHTGERPFRCDACQRAFASASSLNAHAKKHSGAGLRCDRCSKAFEDEARLHAHRLAHDTKPFCCDQCGMQFTRATTLRRHQTRHGATPGHRCGVCRRTFRLAAALRDHARVHTGERPFACEECGHRFALQSTLTTHQRRHTGEKPFKCDFCPRAFAQATPLKRHLKTHRAEAPPPPPLASTEAGAGAVREQGATQPPPPPPSSSSLQPTQTSAASFVTVMEAFTPLPDDRGGGDGTSMGGGGGGMSGGGTGMGGGGGGMSGGGGGGMSGGGDGGMSGGGGGGMSGGGAGTSMGGGAVVMDGGGGGVPGGGEVFHVLQPLPPQDALRCPLCAVETTSKEELDLHMKDHLEGLEEPGKTPQSELIAEWQ